MDGFSSNFDQFPEDIIMEIFSRLPVKSLLKLKSVCKYWQQRRIRDLVVASATALNVQ
uniref:F-box protein At3g07870-like isoform X1 n=1 Tax=Nicotiana sylvestris TaxID=4096 RepID=A0A1U7YS34_NICSY|nr:PREDICTED: F-box protein At3g07870-like isoform X1 [Nicotiana sylvestris]